MKFVTEIIVESRIPTTQYGFNHVTVKSLVNGGDDLIELRNKLLALCDGTLEMNPLTPIEAYIETVDTVLETEIAPVKSTKKPRKLKVKFTTYDRTLEIHKKLFQDALNELCPNWKQEPAKAKNASMTLNGEEFLDSDGIMIENFKTALTQLMAT